MSASFWAPSVQVSRQSGYAFNSLSRDHGGENRAGKGHSSHLSTPSLGITKPDSGIFFGSPRRSAAKPLSNIWFLRPLFGDMVPAHWYWQVLLERFRISGRDARRRCCTVL